MTEKEEKAIEVLNRVYTANRFDGLYSSVNIIFDAINTVLKALEQKDKEIQELKEKWDKDTHTLQNQLDIANADRVEKDKIIDLMANFMNKRSWKEHQVKDDICYCCKIEYSSEECVRCIKQYFKEKASEENE